MLGCGIPMTGLRSSITHASSEITLLINKTLLARCSRPCVPSSPEAIKAMRIAYITPYQGSTLVQRRPIIRNRSVSNKIKIELIARLLQKSGHEVEIMSHGEVIEHGLWFYPGFWETELSHPEIPVYYLSSLPVRRINGFWAAWRALRFLKKRHRVRPFDLVIIFNLKRPQISCAS